MGIRVVCVLSGKSPCRVLRDTFWLWSRLGLYVEASTLAGLSGQTRLLRAWLAVHCYARLALSARAPGRLPGCLIATSAARVTLPML